MAGPAPLSPEIIFAAAGTSLAVVPTLGWRWMFVIGIVPAILAYIIRKGIPESPRWLADHGRHEEARQSLHYVGITDQSMDRVRNELAALPRVADLLTRTYARRMVQTWTMWFYSNFAANAFSVWLPTIYSRYYHIEMTRTLLYTFIIAGTSVVGRICAFSVIDTLGRKPLFVTGYTVAGLSALAFTQATA